MLELSRIKYQWIPASSLEKFIGGLHPKHQNLVLPLGLGDQGHALDVADNRTVVPGVVKRLLLRSRNILYFNLSRDRPE